ncbi:hypothetical protein LOC68_05485 [Blastopirellula sp. JC732]|uniref:Uncharacterized protein n=1 Tax=Blastopirellula sediminis TaxID=2894196 RepID=A0A9X1MKD6_9BACT|nr:hypothetical protein [Blastopirellula sediminis]MCC9609383.1 hypothetical protein [Blastopirellula sediminis]MCC9627840.1 hypothetical protein [Blastopirellula sediminis]
MPTKAEIESQNDYLLQRQQKFRIAAEWVARSLQPFPEVEKVALFGSVAVPLWKEIPRFTAFRRAKIEVYHECKDVDLAVWIRDLSRLHELQRAKAKALNSLHDEQSLGVAPHEVEMFLLEPETDRYLGRICKFGKCPKQRKLECLVPGCGATPFLQQHVDFEFYASALAPDKHVVLFDRTTN